MTSQQPWFFFFLSSISGDIVIAVQITPISGSSSITDRDLWSTKQRAIVPLHYTPTTQHETRGQGVSLQHIRNAKTSYVYMQPSSLIDESEQKISCVHINKNRIYSWKWFWMKFQSSWAILFKTAFIRGTIDANLSHLNLCAIMYVHIWVLSHALTKTAINPCYTWCQKKWQLGRQETIIS